MTKAQKAALLWLLNRNGTGVFGKDGVLVAAGERAPIMRSTWNGLLAAGAVEATDRKQRLTVTEHGRRVDLARVTESKNHFEHWGAA